MGQNTPGGGSFGWGGGPLSTRYQHATNTLPPRYQHACGGKVSRNWTNLLVVGKPAWTPALQAGAGCRSAGPHHLGWRARRVLPWHKAAGARHEFHKLTRREQPLAARRSCRWVGILSPAKSVIEGAKRVACCVVRIMRPNGATMRSRTRENWRRATNSGSRFIGKDYILLGGNGQGGTCNQRGGFESGLRLFRVSA